VCVGMKQGKPCYDKGVTATKSCAALGLIVFIFVLVLPIAVFAQADPGTTPPTQLVPCAGLDCQFCDLATLVQRLIRFAILIAVPIAAGLFAYAGILYFSAAANEGNIGKAKKIFASAFVGFLIALAAFLIVEVILRTLVKDQYVTNWNTIKCVLDSSRPGATTLPSATPSSITGVPSTPRASLPTGVTPRTCSTCTEITGLSVKQGAGTQIDAEMNLRLNVLGDVIDDYGLSKDNLLVTEGHPPTAQHQNACHQTGTCLDAGLRGKEYTVANVTAVQSAATKATTCAVYEPKAGKSCAGYKSCLSLPTTQADHFSIYKAGSQECI